MADLIRFETAVEADESIADGYMKHYLAIPAAVVSRFPNAGRLRGAIDGTTFSRAVFKADDGTVRLRFGMDWLRTAGLSPGDLVTVQLDEDQDPDRVDVPAELAALLATDPAVEHLWEELTPGRQRSLVYGVERSKRSDTRQRRAQSVVDTLLGEIGLG